MTTKDACTRIEQDRAGSDHLIDVFSLGHIRMNAFPRPEEPDMPAYPLTLALAPDSGLVQLRHSVDPELMFREYWYNSGTNESMKLHLGKIVSKILGRVSLDSQDTVVDIGCNDGTLLENYPTEVRKIGYDPARNIIPDSTDIFVNDFFREDTLLDVKAKVVTSIAMLYDVDDPVGFAKLVKQILHPDGVWVIEMHYLPRMLERNEVDAICHEHLCYYSLSSLQHVLEQAGLEAVSIELNEVNGGSMLVFAQHQGKTIPFLSVPTTLELERVNILDKLVEFGQRVQDNKQKLRDMLAMLRANGKKVYGYGASTKGNTLLQYAGISRYLLPAIADRNPQKHGRETVGTRIPIISEEEMRKAKPDYLLALPYHFLEAFQKREPGMKFISPVPSPRIFKEE